MTEPHSPQRFGKQVTRWPPVICVRCRHFRGDAGTLERQLPGVRTLSSAFGAVRAADGLCTLLDRYVAGHSRCERFETQSPA